MKEFFETVGLLIPTFAAFFLLFILIDFYINFRKYLLIKRQYYKLKLKKLEESINGN